LSDAGALALRGVRVVSFGAFVAGNTAGLLLAELGADVVKIEARSRPEVLRTAAYAIGPSYTEPSGVPNTVMYAALSRSTRGLSLDLENPAARPVFHRLVAEADVVIENFAGDTLGGWGCAFDDLVRDNPRLVMLSMSGFGRSGPRGGYRSYASNICGYLGLTAAWGYSHGTLSDYVTAATAALGVAAALGLARRTGVPVHLDVAQIDAMLGLMAPIYLDPLVNGHGDLPVANDVPGSWFAGVLRGLGHDAWVAIELEDADDWVALCRYLGRPDFVTTDPREAARHRPALEAELARWVAERTPHTAVQLLQREGLAVGAVQNGEDIWRDPQLRARGFMLPLEHPDIGPTVVPRPSHRMSRTPATVRRAGPRLGQHTDEVLREWLAIDDSELVALEAAGAAFRAPAEPAPPEVAGGR
jgi:crotonobetainyl-CoA:carnitine CoA-transferase CaiB-like acyl-CoA transferase